MVNTASTPIPLSATLNTPYSSVNGTILTNPDLNAFNYKNNQTAVVPVPFTPGSSAAGNSTGGTGNFEWDVPAFSISVVQFNP
ncbi:MAG: hypothetical protein Q9227_003579 [Pyrenula ochraceoflavens]